MIAAIVPAHNEESRLASCLRSLMSAAACPMLPRDQRVMVVVCADACDDRTEQIAREHGATVVRSDARNVGTARALGSKVALLQGARWLAFTDADSEVAPDWFHAQLSQRRDVVCGTVQVRDWLDHDDSVREWHRASYRDVDGHHHIHGANLGVCAEAYQRAGGFKPLRSHEDVALVGDLQRVGASFAWSAAPRVITSARRQFRAPDGFGATLLRHGPSGREAA